MTTDQIKIQVKRLDGEKSEVFVSITDTILELKNKFSQKIGIDPVQLRLIFKGSPLRDNETVNDAKLKNNDTIHIILQLNG